MGHFDRHKPVPRPPAPTPTPVPTPTPTPTPVPVPPVPTTSVNARDCGAKGDGEADDTAAFQSALGKGKPVTIPAGTYRITSYLPMRSGMEARVLFGEDATEYDCTVVTPTGAGQHIHLDDLTDVQTAAMPTGLYMYDLVATLAGASAHVVTLVKDQPWTVAHTADVVVAP